ncbi:MAG TPA: outer membrane lipoprotein carrier protein LolA [Acidobacteriaceae bacterium]|nr:outer membrane lipoprotein carrier protein LolA [Acidobacteriaceae bacterium]
MVKAGRTIALLCLGWLILLPGKARAQSGDVEQVLTQLNAAAAKFLSAQADFTWDQFTAAVQDHDLQTGTISYERKKGVTRMNAELKQDNGKPALKSVVYDGGQVRIYTPSIKQLMVMKAGANKGQWESFLTLGFGGSGDDLKTNWNVSLQGTEKINGISVAKLDLVPKEQKVLDMFTHVTIWVDPTRSLSYKQIFYQPSGDSRTATYTNIRYNVPLPASVFEIKVLPGSTTVEK